MAEATSTTQITSNIPEWAKPYAERLLGESEKLSRRGYQAYPGQITAEFNPLQEQAFLDIAGMRMAPQIGQATGLAGLAGLRAQQMGQYDPYQARNYFQAPQMREMQFDYDRVSAPQLRDLQMGPAERVSTESFTRPGATQDYMSPYMQGVVEQQKSQAIQDYSRQVPGLQASGIRSGARGGTREALVQAEAQRNLQNQLGGIQATGLQNAFQQGQQQFNTEQASRLQAALANQQAGLTTGQQNLLARLNTQQLGATQGLQAALANQQARQGNQQLQLNQMQNLNQLGMQGAGLGAQYGLAGAQLGEQSRQYGAGLGMQGLAQQIAAAQALGGLGMNQYQQLLGINQAQLGAGSQIQNLSQQDLTNRYQQFLDQQRLPFQQMSWFSDILRGTPASASTQTLYQQPPNVLGQVAGLGLGLGSIFGGR
jgi:hypothetical protein